MEKLDFYETWQGQKYLENIVKNRKLYRPKTKRSTIFILLIIFIALAITPICFFFLNVHVAIKIVSTILFYVLLLEVYLRFFLIELIKCYQHYAKEETRRRCLCIPSCSEYSILCLKKYLLIKALLKIKKTTI